MGVQHQGHISRKKCRASVGQSIDGTQQAMSDVGQKMLPCTSMVTPLPRIGTGKSTIGYTKSRGNGRGMDNRRIVMVTHTKTEKKDEKDHLYRKTMIARMTPQQDNFHKR
jgi:hypothetical protein